MEGSTKHRWRWSCKFLFFNFLILFLILRCCCKFFSKKLFVFIFKFKFWLDDFLKISVYGPRMIKSTKCINFDSFFQAC